MSNRPSELLDNWLEQYGYDKRRTTGESALHLCYLNISEWNGTDWISRWRMAGASGDVETTLRDAFNDSCEMLSEQAEQKAGDRTTLVNAILLMSHGEGFWALNHPETDEMMSWEDLTDDQKAEAVEHDPQFEQHLNAGAVPVRVVNIVTPEGLAGEVSMFFDGEEPKVERIEQWLLDGDDPKPQGMADQLLMNIFFFLVMLRTAVVENGEINTEALMKVALENADTTIGRTIAKTILKVFVDEMPEEALRQFWNMTEREGE